MGITFNILFQKRLSAFVLWAYLDASVVKLIDKNKFYIYANIILYVMEILHYICELGS